MISFEIAGAPYTLAQLSVAEYDRDHNQLLAHPRPGFEKVFLHTAPDKIWVVSDLKFLVKRVQQWYEQYGSKIALPVEQLQIEQSLPDCFYTSVSFEQRNAVKDIFSFPFSYVWDAPGTGKTRFVLAYCV